jgi:transcriptional regulator with XRE-family HTH domain
MKSKELCTYLERVRSARGMSQENFTDDVVSLRQYRRYLKCESDIPFQIIHQLSEKVGIKTDSLLREFEVAKVEETERINKLYNLVANLDHEAFQNLLKDISEEMIIDSNNRMLFRHSVIMHSFLTKKTNAADTAARNMELINYPKILDQFIVTSIEMLILSSLLDVTDVKHQEKIISKLKIALDDSSFVISGANDRILPLVLIRLAKAAGIMKDYNEVIRYCQYAIKRNLEMRSYYLLDYFYYYSALAYFKLEKNEHYEQMIFHCFNVLHLEKNVSKIEKFTKLIEKDFNINLSEFIIKYINLKQYKENGYN